MILLEEVKSKITKILDSKEFMSDLYEGLDEEKRIELGQFYTPAKICIQMIEKFSFDTLKGKTIIDPTCGSGNLLIACLIAGADYDKLYGNEYDAIAVELCRKRINRACDIIGKPHIKDWQVHQGNALIKDCLTLFGSDYDQVILSELLKKRWGMHGGWMDNPQFYKQEVPVIEELQQEETVEIKSTVELGPKVNNKITVENNTEQADLFSL